VISVVLYGRNDAHGYNLHKRAAISLNAIAEVLGPAENDEILFVDYNTPDDLPSFPEAIADTLTERARSLLRVLRVRPLQHQPLESKTHLVALEPIARNVAVRRSNPVNRWILSTNTDMIFTTSRGESLSAIVSRLPDGFYHLPRFELPESLWEGFDRLNPARIIEQTSKWAPRLHLEEIIHGSEDILFDGPGDFQLALREDLHRIHGFHEEMILGWHVDANLSRRMRLLRGKIDSCSGSVKAYHCDHTRQATLVHRADRVQNDPARFVDAVTDPAIPAQALSWGLAGQRVEEVDLSEGTSFGWLRALDGVLPEARQAPYEASYVAQSYDNLKYEPSHVAPYVIDLLATVSPGSAIAYAGARNDTYVLVKACVEALGRDLKVVTPPGFDWLDPHCMASSVAAWGADPSVFVIEFGIEPGVEQHDRLGRVLHLLDWLVHARPRDCAARVVAINAIHNRFEGFVTSALNPTPTPFSTRVRHGYIGGAAAKVHEPLPSDRSVAEWLSLSTGRALIAPLDEVRGLLVDLRQLATAPGDKSSLWWKARRAAGDLIALAQMPGLAGGLGCTDEEIAGVKARLQRSRFSASAGGATDPLPFVEGALAEETRLANIQDWEDPRFRHWIDRFFGGDSTYPMGERSPQIWQRAAILRALETCFTVSAESRGPRSILLVASSDDPLEGILTELGMDVTRKSTAEELSGKADAVIFAGRSLLADGLKSASAKLDRADQCLGVGGAMLFVAAARLDDGADDKSFARALMVSRSLTEGFENSLGYAPLAGASFALSKATLDRASHADLGPGTFVETRGDSLSTLSLWSWRKVRALQWDISKVVELLQGEPVAGEIQLLRSYSPMEIGASLPILHHLKHHESVEASGGQLRIRAVTPRGHAVWGPYLTLLSGTYRCAIELSVPRRRFGLRPLLGVEVVLGLDTIARRDIRRGDAGEGNCDLTFVVDSARVGQAFELRLTAFGGAEIVVRSIELSRLC
jgi:hypothetical protein